MSTVLSGMNPEFEEIRNSPITLRRRHLVMSAASQVLLPSMFVNFKDLVEQYESKQVDVLGFYTVSAAIDNDRNSAAVEEIRLLSHADLKYSISAYMAIQWASVRFMDSAVAELAVMGFHKHLTQTNSVMSSAIVQMHFIIFYPHVIKGLFGINFSAGRVPTQH